MKKRLPVILVVILMGTFVGAHFSLAQSVTVHAIVGTTTTTTTSAGTTTTTSGGGGGGGGGGGYVPPSGPQIIFDGTAYPKSEVTLLKDAQIVASTIASTNASFRIILNNVSSGNYIFSLYSEDKEGNRSSLLTFPLTVTPEASLKVDSIFISPTISTDKIEVKRGESITVFGQSAPQAEILISVNSDEEHFVKTIARDNGSYLYYFDTAILDYGSHYTKAKSSLGNILVSNQSQAINFTVGTKTVMRPAKEERIIKVDLNSDSRINLVDFSIAAYWYKRPSPSSKVDFNNDGKVNLVDFSILAYYWTG